MALKDDWANGEVFASGDANDVAAAVNALEAGVAGAARLVCATAAGGAGAEDNANSWAKVATISTGPTAQYSDVRLVLSVTASVVSTTETATVVVGGRSNTTGTNPSLGLAMISYVGGSIIGADSFKLVSGGWASDIELWVQKKAAYGKLFVYELARSSYLFSGGTVTYHDGAPWQSAEPIGAVHNFRTNGVYAGGAPVVTTTDAQSLSNKTLTSSTLVEPRVDTLRDSSGNASISNAYDRVYLSPKGRSSFQAFAYPSSATFVQTVGNADPGGGNAGSAGVNAGGTPANVHLDLRSQGSGEVRANYVPVVTTTGAQSLANKTISGSSNTLSNIPQSAVTGLAGEVTRLTNTLKAGANLLANPGFDNPNIYISGSPGVSYSTAQVRNGATSVRVEVAGGKYLALHSETGTAMRIKSAGGTRYYVEMWVLGDTGNSATSSSETVSVGLWCYNNSNTYLGAPRVWLSANQIGTGAWVKVSGIITTPDGTATISPTAYLPGNAAGNVYFIADPVVYEETYFDKNLNSVRADTVYDTNGNPVFLAGRQANAVNSFWLRNAATGSGPQVRSTGPDTNIDISLTSKGTGAINLTDGGSFSVARFLPVASPANYWQFSNSTAGNKLSLFTNGADASISMDLQTKGSGTVQANGVPVVTTTGAQILTNKTLTSPTLTTPAVQQVNAADGGAALYLEPNGAGTAHVQVNRSAGGASVFANNLDNRTDVSLSLKSKGSSPISLMNVNGNSGLTIYPLGTNYLIAASAAPGSDPYIYGTSAAATDVGLDLRTKGAGSLKANGQPIIDNASPVVHGGGNEIPAGDFEDARLIVTNGTSKVLSTTQKRSGTQSLKMTGYAYQFLPQNTVGGAVKTVPCNPGDWVSAEAWVYGDDANQDTSESLYIRIDFLRADSTWANYTSRGLAAGDNLTGKWTKLSLDMPAPANTVGYSITLYQLATLTAVPGNAYYWDDVRATKAQPSTSGRLVGTTAQGGGGAEDGAATWTKIAEFDIGTTYNTVSAVLNITQSLSSNENAVIAVHRRNLGTGNDPVLTVDWVSKPSVAGFFTTNSFKFVVDNWSGVAGLWLRKNAAGGKFSVYELSSYRSHQYASIRYFTDSAWQSAAPTGTVEVTSGGDLNWFGAPLVTTTGAVTLTNKTLSLPSLTNPRISGGLFDSLGTPALAVTATGSTNYLAITNSSGNPGLTVSSVNADQSMFVAPKGAGAFRIYAGSGYTPTVEGGGADTNHDLHLKSQGSGVVKANGSPVGVKVAVPATATSTGTPGQWAADANYHYVCTATDTWRRAALSTW